MDEMDEAEQWRMVLGSMPEQCTGGCLGECLGGCERGQRLCVSLFQDRFLEHWLASV